MRDDEELARLKAEKEAERARRFNEDVRKFLEEEQAKEAKRQRDEKLARQRHKEEAERAREQWRAEKKLHAVPQRWAEAPPPSTAERKLHAVPQRWAAPSSSRAEEKQQHEEKPTGAEAQAHGRWWGGWGNAQAGGAGAGGPARKGFWRRR